MIHVINSENSVYPYYDNSDCADGCKGCNYLNCSMWHVHNTKEDKKGIRKMWRKLAREVKQTKKNIK
jgi:hypothetical protein